MAENGDTGVDGLLREFLLETRDTLDAVETYRTTLVGDPADADAQKRLRELVHSVKGACGFLPLPRLEAVAAAVTEAADTLTEDGQVPTPEAMEAILAGVGRMRDILDAVDRDGVEPSGATADADLITTLVAIAGEGPPAAADGDGGDAGDAGDGEEAEEEVSVDADLAAAALLDIAADQEEPEGSADADLAAAALLNIAADQAAGPFYVVFRAGDDGPMALDAAHVVWLDLAEAAVPAADGGSEARVRGEAIPLRTVDGGAVDGLPDAKPVIVVAGGGRRVALVVDEVIDVTADPEGRAGAPVAVVGPERFLGT